jgi:uncharacterized membrane protein
MMRRSTVLFLGTISALIVVGALLAGPFERPGCTSLRGADYLEVSLSQLPYSSARFFCYRDNSGERLRFLLARDSRGKVYSVFDACRQCFKFHKGYIVKDGYVICRLCGTRYKLSDIRKGKASCVPVSLPLERQGDKVEVKVADLERGKALF